MRIALAMLAVAAVSFAAGYEISRQTTPVGALQERFESSAARVVGAPCTGTREAVAWLRDQGASRISIEAPIASAKARHT